MRKLKKYKFAVAVTKARLENRRTKKFAGNSFSTFSATHKTLISFLTLTVFSALFLFSCSRVTTTNTPNTFGDDGGNQLEKALYTKQEFFGTDAFVPVPTRTAQENLTALLAKFPDDPQILEKLAETNEKIENFTDAESNLKHLAEINDSKNDLLITFYERRSEFETEAATLEKMLETSPSEKRAALFERLVNLARLHDLNKYLNADFYARISQENADVYPVFEKIIEQLSGEKDYSQALDLIKQAKGTFPEKQNILLDKEIEILLATNKADEAEKVYRESFDPFWSEEEAQKFYSFLSNRNHLRVYGNELKTEFKKNPANFDAAIRLALYRDYDYSYGGGDQITPIILRLEQAKKSWTLSELVTATRLLLIKNEGAAASRFLYTLFLRREDFQTNPELRAKILYQLFEMFSDAETQKLPLSKGDLRFYEDVAESDTEPGITTGILSLIFSDSNPREKLAEQEKIADRHYNRAAAFRIFEEYKRECEQSPSSDNPASAPSSCSTELAQMYLDLVRLYAATNEPKFAGKILDEFAARFGNSDGYSRAALKLAAAYSAAGREDKARETYQKTLDYLGKESGALSAKTTAEDGKDANAFNHPETDNKSLTNPPDEDAGINIPKPNKQKDDYRRDDERAGHFHDYLTRQESVVNYADVLEKLVASLAAEKKILDILTIYSNEIQKYPAEEWLYEKRLEWLEQTNFSVEKLEFYKLALAHFPNAGWRDKLARLFIRQKRKEDFAAYSEELIGKLNDREIEDYLAQFASNAAAPNDFDERLNLKLYEAAHERFPHNINFVRGLLKIYESSAQEKKWLALGAAYYFESKEIREVFLNRLAEKNELRNYLQTSEGKNGIVYDLFRADAAARLSDFENAIEAYRRLNEIYPHTPEFSERLISFTRSFGQKNRAALDESFALSKSAADFNLSSAEYRTRSGEIAAELGDYKTARDEWEKLIPQRTGESQNYLETAAVYWDYFQYQDALVTIEKLRRKFSDPDLYAFETGAILESQHKDDQAISEYMKALAADGDEEKEKAEKQLAKIILAAGKEKNVQPPEKFENNKTARKIEQSFQSEKSKRKNESHLTLAYAELLIKIRQPIRAAQILDGAAAASGNEDFLLEVLDFYQTNEIKNGEKSLLQKLAKISVSPRKKIQYRLELAQNLARNNERGAAKNVLESLNKDFPLNFGVITETSAIYRRLGFSESAVNVLENALPKSRGAYRAAIVRKLSVVLIRLDKLGEAEKILTPLYEKDSADLEIFDRLADIYVRRSDAPGLRKIFGEALKSLKESGADKRETDEQIAEFRSRMINAFTALKDYQSAVDQYIEIINRDPDDEETSEKAIRYVKRYGGAERLSGYYQKLSAESFKNYRWSVVLARINLANNDAENALKNYQTAIADQPEMPELYLAVSEIESKRNNYESALKNLDEVLALTDNAPEYVKRKIAILKKAGRFSEIEAEKVKLPAEDAKITKTDQFDEARSLANTEREKSLELFRQAFENLSRDPLSVELKAADIAAYVAAARTEESLAEINTRLWNLRENFAAIAVKDNSPDAGEARKRIQILDGVITESIGEIAKSVATDVELADLHADLERRIGNSLAGNAESDQILSLIQNLSRRAGFGDLEEKILLKKLDMAIGETNNQTCLQSVIDFYSERGAYQKNLETVEKYAGGNLLLRAETARLAGDHQKETETLRAIYDEPLKSSRKDENQSTEIINRQNENILRYLDILYSENRAELESLTKRSSVHQLQLINFLIGKNEKTLAHQAIKNSDFSAAWKAARNAETSLYLKVFDERAECYFCEALQFAPIGEMIRSAPDKTSFLINDDWFRLTREYGEWLKDKSDSEADDYLPAMTENQPKSAEQQFALGEFYLERKEYQKAVSHINLAIESDNSPIPDEKKAAALGAALYLTGEKSAAEKVWAQIFEGKNEADEIAEGLVYLQILQKYNLADEGRKPLPPLIVKFLAQSDADRSEDFQTLIRALCSSFTDEAAKAKYFEQILKSRPTDTSLAEMLLKEKLIDEAHADFFYQRLIEKNSLNNFSYDFEEILQRVWSRDDAESIYDQENNYEDGDDSSSDKNDDSLEDENWSERGERWREKYLQLLVSRGENLRANQFIKQVEKEITNSRAPRPVWLRLEKIRLELRGGNLNLAQTERLIGITLPDSATEIKPPGIERFNKVLKITKDENRADLISQISEAFFARNLALGEFDQSNFTGLAQTYFERGKKEKALNVLQLLTKINDESERGSAMAELSALPPVKAQSADIQPVKISGDEKEVPDDFADASNAAADTAFKFGQSEAAIAFRTRLASASPENALNKIALAKLLIVRGGENGSNDKSEGIKILNEVVSVRNAPRVNRWQARMILFEQGEETAILTGAADFDALALFYRGTLAAQSNQNEQAISFFINSLIADTDAETNAYQDLIKAYALTGKYYAALKLADAHKSVKLSDELLQILSDAAEKTGDFQKAIGYEKLKTGSGNRSAILRLEKLAAEKNSRAADLIITEETTQKL